MATRREVPPEALLARVPLLQALDQTTLARLAAVTTRHAYRRGDIVFRQGERLVGMYAVVHGQIRLLGPASRGGTRLTGIVGAGESFGDPMLFLERPAVVTAEAAGEALLLRVPQQALFDELEHNPRLARGMLVGMARRVEGLVRELELQALSNGTERFVAWLLRGHDDLAAPLSLTLPTTKSAIASHLNLTPEHFSRILQDLQQAGLLQVRGRQITVPRPDRLQGGWARW